MHSIRVADPASPIRRPCGELIALLPSPAFPAVYGAVCLRLRTWDESDAGRCVVAAVDAVSALSGQGSPWCHGEGCDMLNPPSTQATKAWLLHAEQ